MKKKLSLLLVICLFLSVFTLTGCGNNNDDPEQPEDGPITGGWTVSTEAVTPVIPDEAKTAFDSAVADLAGAGYEPIAYLGSQVVAGSNYGFLCRVTAITAQPEAKLCIVKVNCDLQGNSSILDVKDISIADYTADSDVNYTANGAAGGWTLASEEPAVLPDDVQTAFDKALEGFAGIGYQPVAYLGSQVVAGSNYAILCNAVKVTAEPQSALAVVTVYADLEGGAQITSVSGFDFP